MLPVTVSSPSPQRFLAHNGPCQAIMTTTHNLSVSHAVGLLCARHSTLDLAVGN